MGAANSVTDTVNKVIQSTKVSESCHCNASSIDQIGNITIGGKNCILPPFNITQNAKAKCSCDVSAAISQLASTLSKSNETVQSAFSASVSNNSQTMNNEQDIKSTLNSACSSFDSASTVIKSVKYQPDCTDMTTQEKEMESKNAVNIMQSSSAQASCLLKLAQKMQTKLASDQKGDTKTQNPLASLMSAFMGLETIMSLAAGFVLLMLVIAIVRRAHRPTVAPTTAAAPSEAVTATTAVAATTPNLDVIEAVHRHAAEFLHGHAEKQVDRYAQEFKNAIKNQLLHNTAK